MMMLRRLGWLLGPMTRRHVRSVRTSRRQQWRRQLERQSRNRRDGAEPLHSRAGIYPRLYSKSRLGKRKASAKADTIGHDLRQKAFIINNIQMRRGTLKKNAA
jgi:hypothetical protein